MHNEKGTTGCTNSAHKEGRTTAHNLLCFFQYNTTAWGSPGPADTVHDGFRLSAYDAPIQSIYLVLAVGPFLVQGPSQTARLQKAYRHQCTMLIPDGNPAGNNFEKERSRKTSFFSREQGLQSQSTAYITRNLVATPHAIGGGCFLYIKKTCYKSRQPRQEVLTIMRTIWTKKHRESAKATAS